MRQKMINKDRIFASAGAQDTTKTGSDFSSGMIPNTVAMAEDVNTYGNMSDRDLWVVCQEIVNLMANYGLTPNDSYSAGQQGQLAQMFQNKVPSGYSLTGIDRSTYTSAPTQSGTQIRFPQMGIVYNLDVYYGKTQSRLQVTTLKQQTLSATSGWADGVHYIYATTTSGSSVSTLGHQTSPVLATDGATKCMLGSVFVIDGKIQAGSWKFEPWLQITSPEKRESPTASTKGGYVAPYRGTQLQMGALQILAEGINFDANPNAPSIVSIGATKPFTYKYLYPDYNPSAAAVSNLDTTHIYNMTAGTWDDISSLASKPTPSFIVVVPCVTPTGQTLMIPAMSTKSGTTYAQVFSSQDAAAAAIFNLQYDLGNVATRAIYLGQSLVVKVGATDLTDPEQFLSVGMLPQALAGFTNAAGQSGGGAGAYIPMPAYTWGSQYTTVNAQNCSLNIIEGSSANPVLVVPPSPNTNIINQFEVQYYHASDKKGLTFKSGIKWWGSAPTWSAGQVYNIIFEYVNGKWRAGYLTMAN